MSEWREYSILDFAEIHNQLRVPLSKMQRAKKQGIYPYYGASGIIDFVDGYLFDGEFILISEDGENLKSRQTPIAFKANGQFWVNNHAHILKGRKPFHNDLMIYYFQNMDLNSYITGAVQPKLNKANLLSISIYLPEDENEQKAIASVLSSLDDKIDLLHRQNKTLEALAETLFRQWFVEEAEEGWETGKLGDIADINPTYQLKKGDTSSYLEMSNVSTSTFNPEGWYKREFSSGMKFKNGDTLIARITPCLENGKTCYVTFLDEKEIGWGSTEYIVIRMKKPFHPFISYIMAKDTDFRDFAVSSMSGSSGRQRAQADVIKEYNIIIPPLAIIEALNLQLSGITPKLEKNANQIRILEKLRDTLLPKLMSGEVRVKI